MFGTVEAGYPEPTLPCTPSTPKPGRFSILTYNVHLFDINHAIASSGLTKTILQNLLETFLHQTGNRAMDYLDHQRNAEIAKRILDLPHDPDVIVLNEMWNDGLADQLASWVRCRYPHPYRPDTKEEFLNGEVLGSGLMLLSKHPILPGSTRFTRFKFLTGADALALKGFGEATLELSKERRLNIIFTHAQAGNKPVIFDNLRQIQNAIDAKLRASPTSTILLAGDLNIAGDELDYEEMMARFGVMKDAYRAQNPDQNIKPGYTFHTDYNALHTKFTQTNARARFDYVLVNNNPLLSRVADAQSGNPNESLRTPSLQDHFYFRDPITGERLPLSDHFPLWVEFELSS